MSAPPSSIPANISKARDAYCIFQTNPGYPGLRYHTVIVKKSGRELHAVSIGIHYRALVQEKSGVLEWF